MKKSLSIGRRGEDYIVNLFKEAGMEAKAMDGQFEDYDLECKVGRKKFTCEVKYDVMAQRTGNLAIEFWNSVSEKHSGINCTKADIWIHIVMDDNNMTAWAISVDYFKKFINNNDPKRIVENAGDGNASLYLYPDSILQEEFTRLDNVELDKLKKAVRKLL